MFIAITFYMQNKQDHCRLNINIFRFRNGCVCLSKGLIMDSVKQLKMIISLEAGPLLSVFFPFRLFVSSSTHIAIGIMRVFSSLPFWADQHQYLQLCRLIQWGCARRCTSNFEKLFFRTIFFSLSLEHEITERIRRCCA